MHEYNILEKGATLSEASKAIILLHGRGAAAEDIINLADHFTDDSFYVAAPQAHNHTWYPYSFMNAEVHNEPWLSSAVAIVKRLIDQISVVLPTENIFIAGFSQGACLALETAARYASKYAGIIAFSGGLIGEIIKREKYSGHFNGTKIFTGISDNDPHVPLIRCERSIELLKSMGADTLLKIYHGTGHTITPQEITDVKQFMFLNKPR